MAAVPAREPLEPRGRDRVQNVAVEHPLEEAQEQVHPQEAEQEREPPGRELLGPHAREQEPERQQQQRVLRDGL